MNKDDETETVWLAALKPVEAIRGLLKVEAPQKGKTDDATLEY